MEQEGIPATADEWVKIADHVLDDDVQVGAKIEDIIFDPLVMTVGVDEQAARATLETIRRLREVFLENYIIGGTSNVSFDISARHILNANFLALVTGFWLNVPVTDATHPEERFALLSADIFLG